MSSNGAKPPDPPIGVRVDIGAEKWGYVERRLREMADTIASKGWHGGLVSGGGGGSLSVTVTERDVSREQYRDELDAWWRAQKTAEPPKGGKE